MHLEQARTDELAALVAVAREGSFVAAASVLRRHPTIVSKRIAALERRLGVRLLERTTRQIRLTEAGARLAERIQNATNAIFEAEQEAAAGGIELKGRLRWDGNGWHLRCQLLLDDIQVLTSRSTTPSGMSISSAKDLTRRYALERSVTAVLFHAS